MHIDSIAIGHESLLGGLSASERHALAVHMDAAQSEARSGGMAPPAMLCELIGLADATSKAAKRKISPAGVVQMEAPPKLR